MAYVPENKYKILYTNGGEFRIANTTKPYIGKYIRLTNGKIFAGDDLNNHKGHLVPLVISRTIMLNLVGIIRYIIVYNLIYLTHKIIMSLYLPTILLPML